MTMFPLPRVQWHQKSNLDTGSQHSLLMSVLRGLAAIEVVAAHLRAQLFPSLKSLPDPAVWYQALAFFTGFAHQAVVIFFLLSGWLVGGSYMNKLGSADLLTNYAIDRITRLWIVLVPAFVLTLLIGMLAGHVVPHAPDLSADNPYSLTAFVGNLFGLQDLAVPRFGGNFALWSLANETWYYILLPLVLLPITGRNALQRLAGLVLPACAAVLLDTDLVLYFGIWLMGVVFSRIRIVASLAWRRLLLAALLTASVLFRLTGNNDILVLASLGQDVLLSTLFLAYLCCLQTPANHGRRPVQAIARVGEFFAAFSFTLYVVHVPLLVLLRDVFWAQLGQGLHANRLADLGTYLLLLGAIIVLAYLFHLPFEAQTARLRCMVKELLAWGRARPGELAPE